MGGVTGEVSLTCTPRTLLLKKGEGSKLTCEIKLPEYLSAPIHQGDEVGYAEFSVDGRVVESLPLTAAGDVAKIGYFSLLSRFFKRMLLA